MEFNVRDKRRHEWYSIDNIFLRGGWGKLLGPIGIAVYNALALHASKEEQSCYPSQSTIADLIGVSRQSVSKQIQLLKACNIIATEQEQDGQSLTYYLLDRNTWIPVNLVDRGCQPGSQGGVNLVDTNNPHDNKPKEQPTPTAGETASPKSFEDWLLLVKESRNKQATIVNMIDTLFPDGDGIHYGRVVRVARQVGGYGRLAQLIWQANSYRPTGDILSYCIGLARGNSKEPAQEDAHPGDKLESQGGRTKVRLGQ